MLLTTSKEDLSMLSGQWAEHTALMGSSAQCGGVRDAGSKQFSPGFFFFCD